MGVPCGRRCFGRKRARAGCAADSAPTAASSRPAAGGSAWSGKTAAESSIPWCTAASSPKEHSEELTASIDREIRRFVMEAYARAKDLVSRYRTALDRLAQELLKRETLDKEDVDRILADLIPQPVG